MVCMRAGMLLAFSCCCWATFFPPCSQGAAVWVPPGCGPGWAPHPAVQARSVPAPLPCARRASGAASSGSSSSPRACVPPARPCKLTPGTRGFLPPATELPRRPAALRPRSAPAPWRRLRGCPCTSASPRGVFHGWWRALLHPAAHTRARGPARPGKGRPRGCAARGRGPAPRPSPRPQRLAVTRHRHVRAFGSWQVSKTGRSAAGGRPVFPGGFAQKKKNSLAYVCHFRPAVSFR